MKIKKPKPLKSQGIEFYAFGSDGHMIAALDDAFRNGTSSTVHDFLQDRLAEARDHEQYQKTYPHVPIATLDVLCGLLAKFIEDLKADLEAESAELQGNDQKPNQSK